MYTYLITADARPGFGKSSASLHKPAQVEI